MTLCDLARQWFTSTKFASYDEMKKKFTVSMVKLHMNG